MVRKRVLPSPVANGETAFSPGLQRPWLLQMVERYGRELSRYAGFLTGEPGSAQAALEATFLQALDLRPGSLASGERAWLFSVCRSSCLASLRPEVEGAFAYSSAATFYDAPTSVRRYVRELSGPEQEVFRLAFQYGFAPPEIALVVDQEPQLVLQWLSSGVSEVRHRFFLPGDGAGDARLVEEPDDSLAPADLLKVLASLEYKSDGEAAQEEQLPESLESTKLLIDQVQHELRDEPVLHDLRKELRALVRVATEQYDTGPQKDYDWKPKISSWLLAALALLLLIAVVIPGLVRDEHPENPPAEEAAGETALLKKALWEEVQRLTQNGFSLIELHQKWPALEQVDDLNSRDLRALWLQVRAFRPE